MANHFPTRILFFYSMYTQQFFTFPPPLIDPFQMRTIFPMHNQLSSLSTYPSLLSYRQQTRASGTEFLSGPLLEPDFPPAGSKMCQVGFSGPFLPILDDPFLICDLFSILRGLFFFPLPTDSVVFTPPRNFSPFDSAA